MNFNWGFTWFHLITTQHKSTFFYTQKGFVSQIYHFFRFLFSLSMCHSDNIFHSIDWNGQPRNSLKFNIYLIPWKTTLKFRDHFIKIDEISQLLMCGSCHIRSELASNIEIEIELWMFIHFLLFCNLWKPELQACNWPVQFKNM